MNPRIVIAVVACVAAALPVQAASEDEGVFEPGVQHVCVPSSDGEGWDCGTDDQPPKPKPSAALEPAAGAEASAEVAAIAEPSPVEATTPDPPPFLMDPDRNTPYAPVEDTPVESAPAEAAPVETAPVVATETPTPAVMVPEDGIDASISAEAGRAELVSSPSSAPAASEAVSAEPAVAEPAPAPAVVESAPAPAPAVVESAPTPTPAMAATAIDASILGDARAFAALPPTAFTLQLAYGSDRGGFPQLVAALGLDPAQCYVLRVRAAAGSAWLLAHGAFADVQAARAAQAALPKVAGLSAQWPRRIGALQTETAQGQ
jgi:hypothetical protein